MWGGESIGWALAFEFLPAAVFGSATAYSAAIFLGLPQFEMTPFAAGAAAFCGIWLGLRKFGRPDLVLLGLEPDGATEAALMLRDVAATLASGDRIEPGDNVATPAGRTYTAELFDAASAPVVAVEGDAILLR